MTSAADPPSRAAPASNVDDDAWPRVIVHADMDAFYAAVEQLDFPELRGKPLLIGHPGKRSVVSTASYEARPFGVGSAMPMVVAMRRCPQAIVVPPRMERYAQVSGVIMETFGKFSPLVEALSLDEAFIDMSGAAGLFGDPASIGRAIKSAVFADTGGLRVSIGIATSKYVAKVASDVQKPDGLTLVDRHATLSFLHALPISRLWGVGAKNQERLAQMGLSTIADVARRGEKALERELGSLGRHIHRLSMGEDPREVIPEHDARSIGSEVTLENDVSGRDAIRPHLIGAADVIARRLRAEGLVASGVRVKLKNWEFRISTRQRVLPTATDNARVLIAAAEELLARFDLSDEYRLIGLAAYDLAAASSGQQELFANPGKERDGALDRAVDEVQDRFGRAAIRRASDL